jgi:hypothetical protein
MGTLPVKAKGIEELIVDCFYDLADSGNPLPQTPGPSSLAAVSFRGMDDPHPVTFEPTEVVFGSLETLVGDIESRRGPSHARKPRVRVGSGVEESLSHRLVGGGGACEAETRDDTFWAYGDQQPEAFVPSQAIGPSDVGISSEPSCATALCIPDNHCCAVERLVGAFATPQHLCQMQGHFLDETHMGTHEAVELRSVGQSRESAFEVIHRITVEVPLACEATPSGEDSEGYDLSRVEGGIRSGASLLRGTSLVEVVHHNVKCGEEGVHIDHESVPFPSGSVSRPTLERGHLPFKFCADNSHQAFKSISDLDDKSAAGIVKAADKGVIAANVRYSKIISEARNLVSTGRGDWMYAGSIGDVPKWNESIGE